MYSERSQYRRYVARIRREDEEESQARKEPMDLQDQILSITKAHADILRTGLDHGEEIALSKLTRFINGKRDAAGLGGLNEGYRQALFDVEAEILRLMKEKRP